MKIQNIYVNTPLRDYEVKIDWRSIMNYAAAIEDDNPIYFDDEREDDIVAHPVFIVAVTWPIIKNLEDYILLDKFPTKVLKTVVHYTEHIRLYRSIKPKDSLIIKGKIVAMLSHRSGTHIILRLDAFDTNKYPVFTEYTGAMLRNVNLIGEDMGISNIPKIPLIGENLKPLWKKIITIDRLRPYIYDGCTDIVFPIHTSNKFAHFVGLPGIILQGTATLAYAVKELVNNETQRNPSLVEEISCKFTGMVIPGTDIEIHLNKRNEIKEKKELYFEVFNNKGRKAITNGYLAIKK
ncbi:MAG: MaoC/PaaZ C-terminal domain-containing protein [Candidatus Hodarchaeota archaeon]